MTHQPPLIPDRETPATLARKEKRDAYRERLRHHLQDPAFRAFRAFPSAGTGTSWPCPTRLTTLLAPTPSGPRFCNNGKPSALNYARN